MIAALAKDPDVMKRSGGTFITAELAQEYGVTDIDGKRPAVAARAARLADLVAGISGAMDTMQ